MAGASDVQQGSLVIRLREGAAGRCYWDAQWRYRPGDGQAWRLKKRRLGLAWQEPDGDGGWRKRKGRCPAGWLDERAANVAAVAAMQEHAVELAEDARRERAALEHRVTVRELAHDWLSWLEQVKGAKPSTLADYRFLIHEPGVPHRRGAGVSHGRIMGALGDLPAADVTTSDVSRFLRSLDSTGLTPRSINKHRQVLAAMFTYGSRSDTHALPFNPVTGTDKRRENPPAALDYYEVEEVEALARACENGKHRTGDAPPDASEAAARRLEDNRDAEAFRLLFYTGLRLGELLPLRWEDVDLHDRLLLVRRGLSAGHETLPKGRQHRFVPLSTPAATTLARLAGRSEFTAPDDYVVCNRIGRRLDPSALRRRYKRACEAAGLRPVKLHGLRHAAGSLVARTTDAVFVRDFLGHAKLSTTDRYVSAKLRPEELQRLDAAFAPAAPARVEAS
ncbi:MAG TPA: tyrosine-type recombinase/integrase [Solirubrobacteraceae bacterium]|nr:tyrosine-type recombinase/integrase [Solirubrobacteraceae bacterium]